MTLKISDVIATLTRARGTYGDLPVRTPAGDVGSISIHSLRSPIKGETGLGPESGILVEFITA